MYTYIYHTTQPHVGKYTIHGWYGIELSQQEKTIDCRMFSYQKPTVWSQIETPFAESDGTSICVFSRKKKQTSKLKKKQQPAKKCLSFSSLYQQYV